MDHGDPAHDAVADALLELEQSHERFPSLFGCTRDLVVLMRLDGRVVTANPATLTIVGFRPAELAGVHFRELILAKNLEAVAHAFARASRGETETFELTLLHKSGHAIDFSASLVPAIAHGRIVGVYAIGKDVSDLKVVEHRFDREIQALSSLIQHHPDSVVALDREGTITRVNAQMETLIGYREDEMVGRNFAQFISPDVLASTAAVFVSTIAGDTSRDVTTIVHKSGRRIDTLGIAVPITVDGEIVGMYSIGHDVTEQRRLEASVAEQTDRLRDLYVVAATTGRDPDAQIDAALELGARRLDCESAYLARVHGRMVEATRSLGYGNRPPASRPLAESLLRFPMQTGDLFAVDDLEAPPWNGAIDDDDRAMFGFYAVPVEAAGVRYGAVAFVARSPRQVPFSPPDREFLRLVGALVGSAVERGAQQRRLDTLAHFDPLTGLPNRILFADRLADAADGARRRGVVFAVHFVDLSGFKSINSDHGHSHGDAVLRALAQRFERITRDGDVVARVGGDAFVVLQSDVRERDDALQLAERIRETLAAPLELEGVVHRLGSSVGIAVFPEHGEDETTLVQRANEALTRVRATGIGAAFATAPSS